MDRANRIRVVHHIVIINNRLKVMTQTEIRISNEAKLYARNPAMKYHFLIHSVIPVFHTELNKIESLDDMDKSIERMNDVKSAMHRVEVLLLGLVETLGISSAQPQSAKQADKKYDLKVAGFAQMWLSLKEADIITELEHSKFLILTEIRGDLMHDNLWGVVKRVEDGRGTKRFAKHIKYDGTNAFTSMMAFYHLYYDVLLKSYDEFALFLRQDLMDRKLNFVLK